MWLADVNGVVERAADRLMVVRPCAGNRFEEVFRGGVYHDPAVAMYDKNFT